MSGHAMTSLRSLRLPALAGLCLALAACGSKEPGEDAAATVDGYEITIAELNHELAEQGVTELQNPAARSAALEAIINRKLLASMAQDNALDQTPDFILRERRTRELLLSQAAIDSLSPQGGRADPEEVRSFLEGNLAQGRERTIFAVDALQFPMPRDRRIMDRLQAASSFEAVRAVLSAEGIEAQSARLTWDSVTMPTDLVRQLSRLPASEPFLMPSENTVVAGVVRDRRSMPLNAEQSRSIAEMAVTQQTVRKRVSDWLEQARFSADVRYGQGYAPGAAAGDTQEGVGADAAPPEGVTTPAVAPG